MYSDFEEKNPHQKQNNGLISHGMMQNMKMFEQIHTSQIQTK